jgi:PAS domain S-box-containing protein
MTGYEKDEVIGKNCRFLQGTDRDQEEIRIIRESILQKNACQVILRNYRKNGELFWNKLTVAPIFTDAGDLICYIGIQQEITNEVLALEEAKKSREEVVKIAKEWRITVDSIPDMIFLTDSNRRILRCNQSFKNFLKLPYERIVFSKLDKFFFPILSFNGLSVEDVFYCSKREFKTGEFFFEVRNYAIENKESSENKQYLHIIRDISKEKNYQIEMRRFETAVNHILEAIIVTDSNGIVQQANSAFEKITLWKKEDLVGRHFMSLSNNSSRDTTKISKGLSSGKNWVGVFEARKKNGEKYLEEMSVAPIYDDFGNLVNYVVVKRDVTSQRIIDGIISSINLAENIGYAFMALRHELGNPVNTIKTTLKVMEKSIDSWEKEKILEYIKRSIGELSRIEYLLGILRSFKFSDEIRRKPIVAKEFFPKFLKIAKEDFESKGIKIEIQMDDVKFLGDERALHQVLLNLFSNASDALEGRESPTIVLKVTKTNSFVEISVADNGIGMTDEHKENIFKPFWSTKPKGSGIGLAIVKNMVSRMFGTIEVESEVGKGTVVKILLEDYDKDTDS